MDKSISTLSKIISKLTWGREKVLILLISLKKVGLLLYGYMKAHLAYLHFHFTLKCKEDEMMRYKFTKLSKI